jgi:hypothetical protein
LEGFPALVDYMSKLQQENLSPMIQVAIGGSKMTDVVVQRRLGQPESKSKGKCGVIIGGLNTPVIGVRVDLNAGETCSAIVGTFNEKWEAVTWHKYRYLELAYERHLSAEVEVVALRIDTRAFVKGNPRIQQGDKIKPPD